MLLKDIKGVGDVTLEKLKNLDILNISDLINFLPKTYIDMTLPVSLKSVNDGQFSLFKLKIVSVGSIVKTKSGLQFFNAKAEDCLLSEEGKSSRAIIGINEAARLVWFNQPYLRQTIQVGGQYLCFAKVKHVGRHIELINPIIELEASSKKLKGILPVYRTKNLIYQGVMRAILSEALKSYTSESLILPNIEKKYNLINIFQAYYDAHFPNSLLEASEAHRRILIEDTAKMITYYKISNQNRQNTRKIFYNKPFSITNDFIATLPFELTKSQQQALLEISDDLCGSEKLTRILAGDVGSGKTIIAFIVMFYAVKCGFQAAMMAPTEILANQHYENAKAFFKGFNVNIVFLSGSVTGEQRKYSQELIKSGKANIIIGTHSVFQKKIEYKNLSLVVMDEQHKFGVVQKFDFEEKGLSVDTLTLSATPIPRSIAMIMYDELKLSQIERNTDVKIKTMIIDDNKKSKMFNFIHDEALKGNQTFIVCPRISDSEGMDMYSATELYDELKNTTFKDISVGLLHGKLSSDKKNSIMNDFLNKKIDVLISTTVIEVGIDIKNATIIAVLNSERFGLATLHQLRGRVGRGDKNSYCFLHTPSGENERLQVLVDCNSGLKIAEMDFAMRGGGDFLGARQRGDTFDTKYMVRLTPDIIKIAKDIVTNDILPNKPCINSDDFNRYFDLLKDITIN
ncbi:MAG: helicase-related protein [Clostridia bacterium]